MSDCESQEACHQDELIGRNRQSYSNSDSDSDSDYESRRLKSARDYICCPTGNWYV
jgi:hypothetical protein